VTRPARAALGASLTLPPGGGASAQGHPDPSARIVVPFGPGGGAERLARFHSLALGEHPKPPVVFENRTGGNGSIGAMVAQSRPDGGTILVISRAATIHPSLHGNTGCPPMGLTRVIRLANSPCLLEGTDDYAAVMQSAGLNTR